MMNSDTLQRRPIIIDYPTLSAVKAEIQKSLRQSQDCLQAFAKNPDDKDQMRSCITYLHQIFGTLQMAEITGASLLAEEMEKTALALLANTIASRQDTLDILLQALTRLPSYLDSLSEEPHDAPILLAPTINQLRHTRAEEPLSEAVLFNPDLAIKPPQASPSEDKTSNNIQLYARKLRPVFQLALLSWLKDKNKKSSLNKLSAVLRELQSISNSETAQRRWWVMGGVIEALHDNGLNDSNPLMLLLSHMDSAIKDLIFNGETANSDDANEGILKECLYYIGKSQSNGPLIRDIKNSFSLQTLLAQQDSINSNPNAEAHSANTQDKNIPAALLNDLQKLKSRLDNLISYHPQKAPAISGFSQDLKNISAEIEKLGHLQFKKIIEHQLATLSRLKQNNQPISDEVLLDIATSLIQLEDYLAHPEISPSNGIQTKQQPLGSDSAQGLRKNQTPGLVTEKALTTLHHQLLQESLHTLALSKDALNKFCLQPDELKILAPLPELLAQIKAAIVMMHYQRPAEIVGAINDYIQNRILHAQRRPDNEQLDAIADAITSIELFFEAVLNGHDKPEAALMIADISLQQLLFEIEASNTTDDNRPINYDIANNSTVYPAAELMAIFIEEAGDILEKSDDIMSQDLNRLTHNGHILDLQRLLHTLKGSARMAGASSIAALAHNMESLLDAIGQQILASISDYQALLQRCYDWLASALDATKTGQAVTTADALINEIMIAINSGSKSPLPPVTQSIEPLVTVSANDQQQFTGADEKYKSSREIINFIEEFNLGPAIENNPPVSLARQPDEYIRVKSHLVNQLIHQTEEINCSISQIAKHIKAWNSCSNTIPHTYANLRSTPHADDTASSTNHTNDFYSKIDSLLLSQRNITDQLLAALLDSRKVNFSSILPRLRRIMRMSCREINKEASLQVYGPDIAIDRIQLNHLTPILEHLVRNAVCHGIELPFKRQQAGKQTTGAIDIHISTNETATTISINDDGAGINIEDLRQHALKQKIIASSSSLSDEELLGLIFKAGFSTVTTVTEIAGRGLGLNVVKNELEYLNGNIEVKNHGVKGLSFTICIPTKAGSHEKMADNTASINSQDISTKPGR